MNRHKLYIFLVLFLLLVFHGLNNYYILTKSRYCMGPDSTSYFERILRNFQALREFKSDMKLDYASYQKIFRDSFKPPLFFLTAAPFLSFGINKNNMIMSNLIYFAILLFATYGIGKRLYNFKVGLLSAFLVSMFPTVFALSRVLMVDFALTAMVALTFYLFVLNKFDSFKFSLLTGIVIGLGALIKQSYFIFLLPILFYPFLQKGNLKNKKIVINIIFTVIIGLLISIFYYAPIIFHDYYSGSLLAFVTNKKHIDLFHYSLPLYFYLQTVFERQLFPFFSLLFFISLIFYLLKKKYFIPMVIFISLIFFSKFIFKADRHILPVFPYIAVMISGFTWSLARFRRFLIPGLVIFSFLQYFIICYANPLSIPYRPLQRILSDLDEEMIDDHGLFFRLDKGDWQGPSEETVRIIKNNVKGNKLDARTTVLFIGQTWKIRTALNYSQIIGKLPIEFCWTGSDWDFLYRSLAINKNFNNQIIKSDFIIIENFPFEYISIHLGHLSKAFKQNSDKFDFIKSISFPNGSLCDVYKNKLKRIR